MTLLVGMALAGPVEDGAMAFESGQLDAAISAWQAADIDGTGSTTLHHDLGSAYYRQGDLPRALAHWRHAHLASPRDSDVVHNLALARSRLEVPEPVLTPAPWQELATVEELGLGAALLLAMASAGLLWWRRRAVWVVMGVVGLVLGAMSLQGLRAMMVTPTAVILRDVGLRDLALTDAELQWSVPAGTEVRVERTLGDWVCIRTSRGRRGWIPLSTAALIGPARRAHADALRTSG